jgi:hypothetical protein
MAHFAKLGVGNTIERVEVVSNDIATTEQAGVDFLNNLYGTRDVWKQTSYNTKGGKHWTYTKDENNNDIVVESQDQSKAFRKNYACIDYYYDQTRDAFIPPKPYDSWTLNETTCKWQPRTPKPDLTEEQEGNYYYDWNEKTKSWELIVV